jgi:hypothetical protein
MLPASGVAGFVGTTIGKTIGDMFASGSIPYGLVNNLEALTISTAVAADGIAMANGVLVPNSPLMVNPARLRLPPSRMDGVDPFKLARQITNYGESIEGMPPLQLTAGANGELMINDGVTRATRAALLRPGEDVPAEIIESNSVFDFTQLPYVLDLQ